MMMITNMMIIIKFQPTLKRKLAKKNKKKKKVMSLESISKRKKNKQK